MRDVAILFQSPLWTKVAWTLVAFLWQGTLVAALLAAVHALLGRRRPTQRYAAACAALVLMLACPIATFLRLDSGPAEAAPASVPAAVSRLLPPVVTAAAPQAASAAAVLVRSVRHNAAGLLPWLAPLWVAGVLLLSLRMLGGWMVARRLTRRGVAPAPAATAPVLARLRARLRVRRPVLLLQSVAVAVPTALGTLKPVILLPLSVLTGLTPEGLEAVLAHELAHIRRRDFLVNLLQTAVETLLFYHPAVWWVSRRVRIERENCCDDLAVEATGDARAYARTLVGLEQIRSARPRLAVAANGGTLLARVARLLPAPASSAEGAPRWVAIALTLAAVATLGAASRVPARIESAADRAAGEWSGGRPASAAAIAPAAKSRAGEASSPGGIRGVVARGTEARIRRGIQEAIELGIAGGIGGGIAGGVEGGVSEGDPTSGPDAQAATPAPSGEGRPLSPDELIELKRHGVNAEFLGALASLGYKRVSLDDLLSLKIHGVTPEFISAMNGYFGRRSLDELTSMRIHGVTPEFAKRFKEAGYSELSTDSVLSLRIHGVTPEMAVEWPRILSRRPSVDEIVSARIHGVTPDFASEMRSLGFEPDLDSFVSMRIHGVAPDFVRAIRSLGYSRLSADEVTSLRIHGVTPEFAREVQSLGYKTVSLDDLTSLRIHGVTPEFIRDANRSATPRLSIDELLDLRIHRRTK